MSAAPEWHRSYEMTISREEFLRLLPGAVEGSIYREEGGDVTCGDADHGWRLRLEALPPLCHGTLALPRHRVEIRLTGYGSGEAEAFLSRFESRFQRGGG
jgi:hypothetical protein